MTLYLRRAAVVLMVLSAAACQGSYSTGPQIPNTIPSGTQASPASNATGNSAAQSSASAPQSLSFAFSDAAHGFTCPESNGFGCTIKLNVPPETPAPSTSPKATASSSPTPSAAPSASSSASPSATPTATPSAGPSFALTMSALPKDAPKMVITNKDAPPTTAVVLITLVPSADFTLDGRAIAEFTLPKEQLANRGFAIQLFEETVRRKHHDIHPLYTLAKSVLVKQTLTFSMTPPKLTLPKGRKYFVVLYGDQQPVASASPAGSASPAASASPQVTPSASPKASATP